MPKKDFLNVVEMWLVADAVKNDISVGNKVLNQILSGDLEIPEYPQSLRREMENTVCQVVNQRYEKNYDLVDSGIFDDVAWFLWSKYNAAEISKRPKHPCSSIEDVIFIGGHTEIGGDGLEEIDPVAYNQALDRFNFFRHIGSLEVYSAYMEKLAKEERLSKEMGRLIVSWNKEGFTDREVASKLVEKGYEASYNSVRYMRRKMKMGGSKDIGTAKRNQLIFSLNREGYPNGEIARKLVDAGYTSATYNAVRNVLRRAGVASVVTRTASNEINLRVVALARLLRDTGYTIRDSVDILHKGG